MAKKKVSKKQSKFSYKKFWQKNWLIITVVVILLGVAGFIGVNRLLIYSQKRQFDAAEQALDKLYADIVNEVGQPTETVKDKSCGYRSEKYSRGERSCSISIFGYYGNVVNEEQAMGFAETTANYLKTNDSFKTNSDFTIKPNKYGVDVGNFLSINSFEFKDNGLHCSVEYNLDQSGFSANKEPFRFSVGCVDSAKSEFYPVKN